MQPLPPVGRSPLQNQVLRGLKEYIRQHGIEPGDRLPTEAELALELGVSRNTVREALGALETIGALTRHPKRGSFLRPVDLGQLAELSEFLFLRSAADLRELFVARRTLELSMLPLAARNITPQHLADLEAANAAMLADQRRGGLGIEGDVQFHRVLLAAAGNRFLEQFAALVQEFFRGIRTRRLASEQPSRVCEEHAAIIAALRDGDAPRAQRVMEAHLDMYVRLGLIPAEGDP